MDGGGPAPAELEVTGICQVKASQLGPITIRSTIHAFLFTTTLRYLNGN